MNAWNPTWAKQLLRPAGGGIFTVSTGAAEQKALQRTLYQAASDADIDAQFTQALAAVGDAKVAILAVPSDVGAGYGRGASFGPGALRQMLLKEHASMYQNPDIVDIGDVFVVPQLLHDDMLSAEQKSASRSEIYPDTKDDTLPVSSLSMAELVLARLLEAHPHLKILLLGGDHSVAWPLSKVLGNRWGHKLGILHFDAHTDLMRERLGVRYCFATWAYHANDLIGRQQRLQQVGIRISRKPREHWETTLSVRQHWTADVRARTAKVVAEEIVETFRIRGVEAVYISNDIDGTDPREAWATGTPEADGLHSAEVLEIIERVGNAFPVVASDLVEVAPILGNAHPDEPERTLRTACRYIEAQLRMMLR